MTSIDVSGNRAINAGATSVYRPVLSSDAIKQGGTTVSHRTPPGAAKPVDRANEPKSPSTEFIEKRSASTLGEQSPSQQLHQQLVSAGEGLVAKHGSELNRLQQNLPEFNSIEFAKELEAKKETLVAEESDSEPSKAKLAEAAKKYQSQATDPALERIKKDDSDAQAGKAVRSLVAQAEREDSKPERSDIASGGASSADKGAPPVNVVA